MGDGLAPAGCSSCGGLRCLGLGWVEWLVSLSLTGYGVFVGFGRL